MELKTIGYLLLTVGLFLIGFTLVNMYLVFNGQNQPYKLFNQSSVTLSMKNLITSQTGVDKNNPTDTNLELLSASTVNNSLNLTFYLILMTFIGSSGYKISSLGVQLLRPINVKSSLLS